MGKTLNHYSQQIKALAPDSLILDRARELGTLLLEAKAAVLAAGRRWSDWLETDCALSTRTAQRFMAIAARWDEPAFAEARQQRPDLPLREADKVLASSSTRKRADGVKRTTVATTFIGGLAHYYCPASDCTAGHNVLAKPGHHLLCGGAPARPHPATPLVCSVLDLGGHQLEIHAREAGGCPELLVAIALLEQIHQPLLAAGLIPSKVGVSTGWMSVDNDGGGQLSTPLSMSIDRDGQVKDVFIGQAGSGCVLHATRGEVEDQEGGQVHRPIWQHLEPFIPWAEASQPPAAAASTVPVVITPAEPPPASPTAAQARLRIRNWIKANPAHTNLPAAEQWLARLEANPRSQLHHQALQELFPTPSDNLTNASDSVLPQVGGVDPLQAESLDEACQLAHQLGWPRGIGVAIAERFGITRQSVNQRKQKLARG